ncbi:type VI lipase adapter Tla3 domain-containing protein [Azohydromonas aeria]|uniref:type VI lipase adapter Tla3 domain-containing protein n=1 Tax=Azohydromonas aeria TaxID=2590212 RepID=UPI0012F9134C|nr:DUF2875 family protein [Azohydromonas aeria]
MSAPRRSDQWTDVLLLLSVVVLVGVPWLFLDRLVGPSLTLTEGLTVSTKALWGWSAGLVMVAALVVGFATPLAAAQPTRLASASPSLQPNEQARREDVLEIIGLGVTLDKYRQGKLWDALRQGSPYASIREQDPNNYPWSAQEKKGLEGLRSGDSLENGAHYTPVYWGIPTFAAESPADDPKRPASPTEPTLGIASAADTSGMAAHLFVSAGWELSERPDRLLARVFDFFDEHPDVPYVVLSSSDGMYLRNLFRPKGSPVLIRDGYYVPPMPDSSMLFVLARRERVDAIRPYAFEDVDETRMLADEANLKGYARKLWLAYNKLGRSLPRSPGISERVPTVPEWLEATRAFAQREDIYPKQVSLLHGTLFSKHGQPPRDFKPTPWFPIPWNKEQLAEVDRLPTLGFLHRPVFVRTVDEQGRPLARRAERMAALAAGWQQALLTLPEAERQRAPARVLAATGGQVEQTIALTGVLDAWAGQGGPELDRSQPTQWIDTDARLGNTGAATWFMQMAVGAIASYRDGGASAAINLRDPAEASIVFVTPPSPEKVKGQRHIKGGDVWRSIVGPAVDPVNYAQ